MSSSSDSGSSRDKNTSRRKDVSSIGKKRSFSPAKIDPNHVRPVHTIPSQPVIQDQTGLYDENRKLRRKLKELSIRLDEELERAAEEKLKRKATKANGHPASQESQNMELQNAYKMIERLQKTVRDYESKESYQVTLKRVLDLENIIKKKENEMEQLKGEVKTQKKMLKDKDRYIEELLDNTKKMSNPAEDKELIFKLKTKLKKVLEETDILRKKELGKHEKLVRAERKVVELEQAENEIPIGREESLLLDIEEWKKKHKEAMQRVDRQNIYISKLN